MYEITVNAKNHRKCKKSRLSSLMNVTGEGPLQTWLDFLTAETTASAASFYYTVLLNFGKNLGLCRRSFPVIAWRNRLGSVEQSGLFQHTYICINIIKISILLTLNQQWWTSDFCGIRQLTSMIYIIGKSVRYYNYL